LKKLKETIQKEKENLLENEEKLIQKKNEVLIDLDIINKSRNINTLQKVHNFDKISFSDNEVSDDDDDE
jgi:hypothetical protein